MNTYTKENVEQLIAQEEILPIAEIDEQGEVFFNGQFAFNDSLGERFYIKSSENGFIFDTIKKQGSLPPHLKE